MDTRDISVQHPPKELLAALALGRIEGDAEFNVREHLTECSSCLRFFTVTSKEEFVAILGKRSPSLPDQTTTGIGPQQTVSPRPAALREASRIDRDGAADDDSNLELDVLSTSLSDIGFKRDSAEGEDVPAELKRQTKYVVTRLLGRGGMGAVYEAHQVSMDRKVAIKIINPALVDHPEAIKRFELEAKAAGRAKGRHARAGNGRRRPGREGCRRGTPVRAPLSGYHEARH